MGMRGLTAFFGLCMSLSGARADRKSFDFDFAPGGNAADHPAYDVARGYGFEPSSPRRFSVRLPEGNYSVTMQLYESTRRPRVRVLAEQCRLMIEAKEASRPVRLQFVVNIRSADLGPLPENASGGTRVALKAREIDDATWDDKLTVEIAGDAALRSLAIAPVDVPTLYLAGDSTVTDQDAPSSASWGQMLPRFFKPDIAVANHAASGETLKSFVTELRFAKLLSKLRAGDWVMVQFGHNDQKAQWPQTYADAETTYRAWLRTYIAEIRQRGATVILVTSPERRNFDATGHIIPTLGAYPEAVRALARENSTALIDLNAMSVRFYEALGPQLSAHAFAEDGRDRTHHNEYGAYSLARMVVEGLRTADPRLIDDLAAHLEDAAGTFDPDRPDPPPRS